jgi:hypothetical protein
VVKVKGLAERKVKSNLAIWKIHISTKTQTKSEQYTLVRKQKKVLEEFLLKNGIEKEEIEFGNISIKDSYINSNQLKKLVALKEPINNFTGNIRVTITSSKVDQVKKISSKLDELILEGVPISNSEMYFVFNKVNEIKEDMIREATLNAKKAAQSFARNAGNTVGAIRTANQGYFEIKDTDTIQNWSSNYTLFKKVRVVTNVSFFLK